MEGVPQVRAYQLDTMISIVLRLGVSIAAITVVAGYLLYLSHYPGHAPALGSFRMPPIMHHRTGLLGLVQASVARHSGRDIIDLGLMMLVVTPVVRVAFSVVVYLYEGDYRFVWITLVVLTILLLAMSGV
jgi:uncharacterized membrane protein